MSNAYPGNTDHQRILQAIVQHYAVDPRVLAVLVFGSVGRGNWDHFSDLDLDIILDDGLIVDPVEEVRKLGIALTASDETIALIIPMRGDEADVVCESLQELSIRYHTLATTSPNIVESMRVLAGTLDHATIAAASTANQHRIDTPLTQLVGSCVRQAVETLVALQRQRLWFAIEFLHEIRTLLIDLFGQSRDAVRELHAFQAQADLALQEKLGATLPAYSFASAQLCLARCIALLEEDLPAFTKGKALLTDKQSLVLRAVKTRLQQLEEPLQA